MNKYKLSMKTPSGLGTEYIYVESKYDNFERYLKEHNLKYQKCDFKTIQDKEIERLHSIIKEVREYITSYESIEAVNQVEHNENNKGLDEKTMIEMINRHLRVHDKILEILDKVGDINDTNINRN